MKTSNIIIISILLITFLFSTSSFAQPDNLQEINSSDILKQIENGEDVYISNSLIKGKLDLSSANLSKTEESGLKIVRSQITIENSRFERSVDFSNTLFENEIEFDNCNLYKVDFSKSHFKQDVDFRQSELIYCNFSEVVYHKKADFRQTDFFESNFKSSIFNGLTLFDGSTLTWTTFCYVTFTNQSFFNDATFKTFGDFRKSNFSNFTSFHNVNFEDADVEFTDSNFSESTIFIDAKFGSDAYFTNTTFLNNVDFSKAVFTDNAYFDSATFKKKADFERVEFNEVNFLNTRFENISLTKADFSKMYVEWDNIKDSLTFDGQLYLKLRENFIKLEKYTDSDDVYYNYRKNIREDKYSIMWLLDRAVLLICGYGVKPLNSIGTGFIAVLGFAGYYYCKEHEISSSISNLFKKNDNFNTNEFCKDCYDAFWFSIGVFIGSDYESSYSKNRYQKAVMLEKIIGSLIFTLFVVTLANVMIRI